ncbi:MAG: outer membrane protein assembly factor BamB family protein [Frankiaceae bacterium]
MFRLAPVLASLTALLAACSTGSSATPSTSPSAAGQPGPATSSTFVPAKPKNGVWVDPASVGQPYQGSARGLLTFRGNPTRTWYGTGPVPRHPQVLWRYPGAPMCSISSDEHGPHQWCGQGWTGEPAVFERGGRTWEIFGAYDAAYHFLDADTGKDILPKLQTGDLIKGAVTVDPDGFPFVYSGSRDNLLRVISFQGKTAQVLWSLSADAVHPTLWNDDWDGSPLQLGDYLFEGGENSQIHVIKLNRGYRPDGQAYVRPQLVFHAPGWDGQLLRDLGDTNVSIENSVSISGNTLYFANSGGLVQGWDIAGLKNGVTPRRVFRFWTGEDTDASVVVDEQGYLYVGSELERHTGQGQRVHQIMKLDPRKPANPLVWSVKDDGGGTWATAGLYRDMVIVPTKSGLDYGIDRDTGKVLWVKRLPGETVASPAIVDGVWLQGDCTGTLHAYDLAASYPNEPKELWSRKLDGSGCVESTPAIWNGRIYVGTRGGYSYAIGERP